MRKQYLVLVFVAAAVLASGQASAQRNKKPVTTPDFATTAAGTAVTIDVLANDSDPNGDALSLNTVTQSTDGAVAKSGNATVFTPRAGFTGSATFTYTAKDSKGAVSSAATVTVTVTAPTNTTPVANADSISTTAPNAGSVNLLANDTDANSDALTVTANTQGTKGSVTRSGGTATYTPNAGTSGSDSFTYTISDGKGGTATATVSVTVAAQPNTAPVANADSISTTAPNAGSVNLLANDTDANSDALTVTANTQGTKGSVTRSGGTATYTPNAGTSGSDSFTYTISDGKGGTATGTVSVTIAAAATTNNPPTGVSDAATTAAGKAVTIPVLANDSDPDGDPLNLDLIYEVANGTGTISGDSIIYTPNDGFTGTDAFTYRVIDDKGAKAWPRVTVTVTPPANTAPVANADSISTTAPNAGSVNLLANDTDANSDALTVTANTQGTKGSVTRSGGTATYTPNAGTSGSDSFTYTISDGKGGTATATVSVTVTAQPNTAPVANADSISTTAPNAGSVNLLANDTDANSDALTVTANTQGTKGSVTRSGGTATYTPNAGTSGSDSFTYTISDGKGGTATATVSVTVTAQPNTAPVANADSISTTAPNAGSVNLLANDTDANSDALTVTANTQGTKGSVTRSGGTATYTPNAGTSGSDSFTYTISDGKGGTATGTVSVTIAAAATTNNPPTGVSDAATTAAGKAVTIPVLANDSDPDGDPLKLDLIYEVANGTGTISGDSIIYTPNGGFTGTDAFTYRVIDDKGAKAWPRVTVTVTSSSTPAPTAGSALLSWTVPTTREDGSPLAASDLAGYEIYVLAESTGQSNVITVSNPLATSYTVNNLGPDVYHFSMACKDTSGKLSTLSAVVTKTVAQ